MNPMHSQAVVTFALVAIAIVLTFAPAEPVAAQQHSWAVLQELDSNGDGKLQRDEAPISLLPDFSSIDEDGDDALDSHEVWQYEQRRLRKAGRGDSEREQAEQTGKSPQSKERRQVKSVEDLVKFNDRNKDGRLSLDEVPRSRHGLILRLDQDGDRAVDLEEARRIDARRAAPAGAEGRPRGRSLTRVVELMDTNGDGRLEKREAPLWLQRNFESFDTNGDGVIDGHEAAAADAAARKAAAERSSGR
jgi:Ca2+-binding EF-hand superfamily protein